MNTSEVFNNEKLNNEELKSLKGGSDYLIVGDCECMACTRDCMCGVVLVNEDGSISRL